MFLDAIDNGFSRVANSSAYSSGGCRIFFRAGRRANFIYMQIFQGAKMSLFSYSLAFIFMEHRSFWGAIGAANFSVGGDIAPLKPPLKPPLAYRLSY